MNHHEMGQHLLLEVYDCTFEQLNSAHFLRSIFTKAILRSEMTILNEYTHQFSPCGLTLLFALAESHVSCHTWPEKGCVAMDIFTCGSKNPRSVAWWLLNYFDSEDYNMNQLNR